MTISITKYSSGTWKVENHLNNKQAKIQERYELNLKTGNYGRFYVEGPNGREVKPTNGYTAFDSFEEAKEAAEKSLS